MGSNRPLWRSIVKLAVRLVAGKSRAHVQDWFPGLKLDRPEKGGYGTIRYRGQPVGRLTSSHQLFQSKIASIYIVGSGPSIASSDVTLAEKNSCILLNGALHLIPDRIETPLAVAIEDERFVWSHFDLFERIPADCPCLFSVSVIRAVCEHDETWFRGRTVALIDDIRKPYGHVRRSTAELSGLSGAMLSMDGTVGFSTDPDAGVFQGGSVVISATQFALSWKPEKIGFLGIDISNANEPRFYEKKDKAYSGIRRGQERILNHLEMARAFALDGGIAVVNYSRVSALVARGFGYCDKFAAPADRQSSGHN